ncbi:unnamed product, partial [Ostreococcus tauri]
MNNQAVSACPVRFEIFYRRSVEVRHSPLKHSSSSDSYIQCSVIRVHDLRGVLEPGIDFDTDMRQSTLFYAVTPLPNAESNAYVKFSCTRELPTVL